MEAFSKEIDSQNKNKQEAEEREVSGPLDHLCLTLVAEEALRHRDVRQDYLLQQLEVVLPGWHQCNQIHHQEQN